MVRIQCRRCGCSTVDDVLDGGLVMRCTICDWWVPLSMAVPDRVGAGLVEWCDGPARFRDYARLTPSGEQRLAEWDAE